MYRFSQGMQLQEPQISDLDLAWFWLIQVGKLTLKIQHKLSNLMENLFLPMICTSFLLKGISGMQFSMQIWTYESQAACLAHARAATQLQFGGWAEG